MSNDLARQDGSAAPTPSTGFTPSQRGLIKRTVVHGVGEATDDELDLFEIICRRTGLNPFVGQIWAIRRKEQVDGVWQERMTIQVGIAGYRLIAERTSKYEGMLGPYWCGTDGQWRDVWLDPKPPAAAKVGILKRGFREPLWAVATFAEFAQRTRGGELTRFWRSMPANQLAKCCKALAFREAFPQETSGLYSDAELPEVEVEVDRTTGEIQSSGRLGGVPTPAEPAGSSVPTLDQVRALQTVDAAKDLVYVAPHGFQQHVEAAIAAVLKTNPREFWRHGQLVDDWKQALEYAVELHEQHDHDTSAAEASVPPDPAADQTSPPAQVSTGKADQAGGDVPQGGEADGD